MSETHRREEQRWQGIAAVMLQILRETESLKKSATVVQWFHVCHGKGITFYDFNPSLSILSQAGWVRRREHASGQIIWLAEPDDAPIL